MRWFHSRPHPCIQLCIRPRQKQLRPRTVFQKPTYAIRPQGTHIPFPRLCTVRRVTPSHSNSNRRLLLDPLQAPICSKPLNATICDPNQRTVNTRAVSTLPKLLCEECACIGSPHLSQAMPPYLLLYFLHAQPCGSDEDYFFYSPWRRPGSAPVIDSCGTAGGRIPGQGDGGFGAAFVNTTHAKVSSTQ